MVAKATPRRRRLLIGGAAIAAVVAVLVFGGTVTQRLGYAWVRWKAERAAGPGATDCGDAPLQGLKDQSQVQACVAQRLAQPSQPFVAGLVIPGVDSQRVTLISQDAQGHWQQTHYDSSPSGFCLGICVWSAPTSACPTLKLRRITTDGVPPWSWLTADCAPS